MYKKTSIAILLSTYNGELFLREQLESIIAQSYRDWDLFIKDDGSTDGTINIILEYSQKYSNIHYLDNLPQKMGACRSFLRLLDEVEAEYYMFCDQDDIWLEKKIELTFDSMKHLEYNNPNIPILVCSDLCVVDAKLNVISRSLWNFSKVYPSILNRNFKYLATCNFVTGCTVMINNYVKNIVLPPPEGDIPMHDFYIALRVAYKGIIDYIKFPLILYRQHGNNTIGSEAYPKNVFISKLRDIRTFLNVNKMLYREVSSVVPITESEYWYYKLRYFMKRISL